MSRDESLSPKAEAELIAFGKMVLVMEAIENTPIFEEMIECFSEETKAAVALAIEKEKGFLAGDDGEPHVYKVALRAANAGACFGGRRPSEEKEVKDLLGPEDIDFIVEQLDSCDIDVVKSLLTVLRCNGKLAFHQVMDQIMDRIGRREQLLDFVQDQSCG